MFSKCMAGSGSERKGGVVMQGEIEEKWRSLRASPPGEVVVVLDAPEGFGSVVGVKGACVVEVREVLILFISFVFFLLKAKNAGVLLQHPLRGRRRRRYTISALSVWEAPMSPSFNIFLPLSGICFMCRTRTVRHVVCSASTVGRMCNED